MTKDWILPLNQAAAKLLQSCLTVRHHRRQPTRVPHPWGSPGKNTGVGCHFLLQWMEVKSGSEVAQSCPTLRNPMDCSPPGSSIHGVFQARVLEWVAIAFSARNQEKHNNVSSRYFFPTLYWSSRWCNQERKERKGIYIGKKKVRLSLITDHLVL